MPLTARIVLETGGWFRAIKTAVGAGEAEVFMAHACERELARALGYPLRKTMLDASAQAARLEDVGSLRQLPPLGLPSVSPQKPAPHQEPGR
jgi:hypothetical protein